MQATIMGISGPAARFRIEIRQGERVLICQAASANPQLSTDRFLSGQDFGLAFRGGQLWIADLKSSEGILVNGVRTQEKELFYRDLIQVGQSVYQVVLPDPASNANALLLSQPGYLYAVIDMAQAREPLAYFYRTGTRFESLYVGNAAVELELTAPCLVYLPPDGKLLGWILEQGWGKSWGIFLASNAPFEGVLDHLRGLVLVQMEEETESVFFRFYDPRVLRSFLPIATPAQLDEFFGPITAFLMEEEDSDTLASFNLINRTMSAGRFHVTVLSNGDRAR